jgi:hypothetical protein
MGRTKIKTIDDIAQHFVDYVKNTKENPRVKVDYVGKDAHKVEIPLERPLSYDGFCVYCYDVGFTVHHYFDNPDNRYEDYREVCARIKQYIRQDQIEGGMVGLYNTSITQRLNNLKEQTEVATNTSIKILNIDPLDDSGDDQKKLK